MPILVATAFTYVYTNILFPFALLCICLSAVSIQIATNLHNDARDYLNGTDSEARIGPTRITQSGAATAKQTLNAAYFFFAIAVLFGCYLVWLGGSSIAFIGLASLIAGYSYSAGPYPISRTPFGEAFVLVFFGIVAVSATSYLLSGVWTPDSFLYGLFVGCPACAVLLINNYRDAEGDKETGRKTLSILLGSQLSVCVYAGLMLAPFIIIAFITPAYSGAWLSMLALIIVLPTIYLIATVSRKSELNKYLGISAASQVVMCSLLSIGMVLDATVIPA